MTGLKPPIDVKFERHSIAADILLYVLDVPEENPIDCVYKLKKRQEVHKLYYNEQPLHSVCQSNGCVGEIKDLKFEEDHTFYVHAVCKDEVVVSKPYTYYLRKFVYYYVR